MQWLAAMTRRVYSRSSKFTSFGIKIFEIDVGEVG